MDDRTPVRNNDFRDDQLLFDSAEPPQRRKSVSDAPSNLLNLDIPHYRLGTPRFTDRGTAYLHYSVISQASVGMDSRMSKAEYDNPFPRLQMNSALKPISWSSAVQDFFHPGHPNSTNPIKRPSSEARKILNSGDFFSSVFDRIESNPHDPSFVRYHATTGRAIAVTPIRLIAQITSPQFLDYQLLADFFLTFRCFMPRGDVLEYLIARMRWAFANPTDAGRIARVRTFVALRHWILNYFSDDFMPDDAFRQRFCDSVNQLATSLRQRPDKGGGDINIIGELKKCWRRTCAQFWLTPNALDVSPDVDITPGGETTPKEDLISTLSLPLTIRPTTRSESIFEVAQGSLPHFAASVEKFADRSSKPAVTPENTSPATFRAVSIPTSPMSDHSLEVLSCSVPFLRHLRFAQDVNKVAPPRTPRHKPQLSGDVSRMSAQKEKRSGSISDALRDQRLAPATAKPGIIDAKDFPVFALTGGLVKGMLLQPTTARLDIPVPSSPTLHPQKSGDDMYVDDHMMDRKCRSPGVKKFVGGMRRALSVRKRNSGSSARSHKSGSSSHSSGSGHLLNSEPKSPKKWNRFDGTPRQDVLAAMVEIAYQNTFPNAAESQIGLALKSQSQTPLRRSSNGLDPRMLSLAVADPARQNSHITTGSRSIVIVDATGAPGLHPVPRLPSTTSISPALKPSPLMVSQQRFSRGAKPGGDGDEELSVSAQGENLERQQSQSLDRRFHDFLVVPNAWNMDGSGDEADNESPSEHLKARKSSVAHPDMLDLPPIQQHQLRRRPGGDLKAADHVHELAPPARHPSSTVSLSVILPSQLASEKQSQDLLKTLFMDINPNAQFTPTTQSPQEAAFASINSGSLHSHVRASFVPEAQKLRNLPDEASSDGGIEDALMKLEGRVPSPSDSAFANNIPNFASATEISSQLEMPRGEVIVTETNDTEARRTLDVLNPANIEIHTYSVSSMSDSGKSSREIKTGHLSIPIARSSTSSAPLMTARISRFPIPDPFSAVATPIAMADAEHPDDREYFDKDERHISPEHRPSADNSHKSFLLGDNESLSDISSDIPEHTEDETGARTFFFDDAADDDPTLKQPVQRPPTPPPTRGEPADQSSDVQPDQPSPLKASQKSLKGAENVPKSAATDTKTTTAHHGPTDSPIKILPTLTSPKHMPFVLAFESEIVAEQMTIIEKDVLDEVDWKDLISLNWRQNPPQVRNWVEYVKQEPLNGIDMVITRFNLVVKWIVSEIILTEDVIERARTIDKYIHIASHAHHLRNFATVYQITLALLSSDLARMYKTWSLVGAREKRILWQFDHLCQPLRNFHNLRAEMQPTVPETGCIPFIGLYTHDLRLNDNRALSIEPSMPGPEPLVPFERYQAAAAIVKSLLRHIESSSKYTFQPRPEALSRCLWIATLDDAEIGARSAMLD